MLEGSAAIISQPSDSKSGPSKYIFLCFERQCFVTLQFTELHLLFDSMHRACWVSTRTGGHVWTTAKSFYHDNIIQA